jgi:hypothetical protein
MCIQSSFALRTIVPRKTKRQQTADALHMAFLAQLIAESKASFNQDNSSDSELDMDSDPRA